MSTGLPRPGLARSAHRGRIKFLRGYVSISSAAVNRPTHDHAASLSEVARTSMRSAFRGPAHQLAVRMRINNCTHGHYGPSNQPCTSHAPATARPPRVCTSVPFIIALLMLKQTCEISSNFVPDFNKLFGGGW